MSNDAKLRAARPRDKACKVTDGFWSTWAAASSGATSTAENRRTWRSGATHEIRSAHWSEFEGLDGDAPLWRIHAAGMKGDLDRKEETGGDPLAPMARQSVDVIRATLASDGVTNC